MPWYAQTCRLQSANASGMLAGPEQQAHAACFVMQLQAQSQTMLGTLAALSFSLLAAVVVAFQIALVCGAPFGEITLGGKYRGSLPFRVRVVPAVSACLLAGFAVVVAARAGLAFPAFATTSRTLVWIVIAYCVVGVLANYFTPSPRERLIWLPVVLLLLLTSVIVATS